MSAAHVKDRLDSVLADVIAEAVARPASPEERAGALAEIVGLAVEAVRWRNEPYGDSLEERSLERVLREVEDHRRRMT